MSEISMHIRYYMLYEFQLRNNASAAARHTCTAFGEGVIADCTCRDWFKRFREGDTSLEDHRRSRRLLQSNIERIKVLIEDNPLLTIPGIISNAWLQPIRHRLPFP